VNDDMHPKYAATGTLAYKIPLVPGSSRYAYLELPEDMSAEECARLGRFVESIALIDSLAATDEANVCLNSREQCAYLCTCEAVSVGE
jgi:hypothetical protein